MDKGSLPPDLARTMEFHGHLCPGLMIGWRLARAAADALGVGSSGDEELVAVAENDSCSVDAFQFLLSTTFGKGNLKWQDYGKKAFTLYDRGQGRAVRVRFIGDDFRKTLPDGSSDREAFMQSLLDEPDEKLVEIKEAPPLPPEKARIEPSILCARCGEPTQKSKLVELNGSMLCRACAAKEAS